MTDRRMPHIRIMDHAWVGLQQHCAGFLRVRKD